MRIRGGTNQSTSSSLIRAATADRPRLRDSTGVGEGGVLSGFAGTCRHRRPRAEEAVRLGIEVIRDEALTLRGRSERTRLHTRSGHRKVNAAHSGDYAGTYGFATSTPRRLRPQIDPPPSAQCHGCRLQLSLQLQCVCPRPRRRKATAHVSKRHRARGAARGSPAQRQTSTRYGSKTQTKKS